MSCIYIYIYIHVYLCIHKAYSKPSEQRTHWGQANCREVVLFSEVSIGKSLKTFSLWYNISYINFGDFFNSKNKINCVKNVDYNYDITIQYLSEHLIVVLYAPPLEYMEASILVYPLVRHGNDCVLGLLSMMRPHFGTSLLLYSSEKGWYDKRQS